jgi:hypothetical protein
MNKTKWLAIAGIMTIAALTSARAQYDWGAEVEYAQTQENLDASGYSWDDYDAFEFAASEGYLPADWWDFIFLD